MGKSEQSYAGWYFLLGVVVLAGIVFLIKPAAFFPVLSFFWSLMKKIVPILLAVFVLIFLINCFISPKQLLKYLGKEAKKKGWFVAVISGIISVGPIYLWYPLLSDLKQKGVRTAYIAVFLYNRAVKPALLPLLIFYFGLKFTIVLTIVMIFASVLQGFIVEKIVEVD